MSIVRTIQAVLSILGNAIKSVTIWANTIYQIKNNKIIKSYSFYNEADVYEQLGLGVLN
jgi:predicted ester cyclase